MPRAFPATGFIRVIRCSRIRRFCIAQDVPNAEGRHIRLVSQPFTLSRTPSKLAARPPEF
jgi:hypothetical protein